MVDLQGQYKRLEKELSPAINEVLQSCYFVGGPQVKAFAEDLAEYLNVKHVIPCGNGTDALQLALMAMDLKRGDEVITSPFTFVATVEVIALLGLKPVFVDCLPDSFNIDPEKVAAAITDKTRCIIPIHLFGQGAQMEALMEMVAGTDIYVLEDNAQAIGAEYFFSDGRSQKLG
ncbi:MAG TPA: aminotransferase class I/II-fold pyridoxal phosphate-dependent enzyme, partial [Phaeodactylibacter sp.]|nr:aminotransferase class I/II-fold pyridoxal phosphate-dependent enzyme [Phaeodactylibacter sp.]